MAVIPWVMAQNVMQLGGGLAPIPQPTPIAITFDAQAGGGVSESGLPKKVFLRTRDGGVLGEYVLGTVYRYREAIYRARYVGMRDLSDLPSNGL